MMLSSKRRNDMPKGNCLSRIGDLLVVPTELEAILANHPNVADCAVFKDKQGKISAAVLLRSSGGPSTQVSLSFSLRVNAHTHVLGFAGGHSVLRQ